MTHLYGIHKRVGDTWKRVLTVRAQSASSAAEMFWIKPINDGKGEFRIARRSRKYGSWNTWTGGEMRPLDPKEGLAHGASGGFETKVK